MAPDPVAPDRAERSALPDASGAQSVLPRPVDVAVVAPSIVWMLVMAGAVALAPALGLFDPAAGVGRYEALKDFAAGSFAVALLTSLCWTAAASWRSSR